MKSAQIHNVFKIFLIAIFLIFILLFGYKSISTIQDKICKTNLARFEIDLNTMPTQGRVEEKTYDVPCAIDRIYFIDKNVDINLFDNYPIIKDSIETNVDNNAFLIKENSVDATLSIKNIKLNYPYFLCFDIKHNKLNLVLDFTSEKIKIYHKDHISNCGYIPNEPTDQETRTIINELSAADPSVNITIVEQNFTSTKGNFNSYRAINITTEKTTVKIIIIPKEDKELKDFIYLEKIPKRCIRYLSDYDYDIGDGTVLVDDPLIMWRFKDIEDREEFSYYIETSIEEECKNLIRGIGFARRLRHREEGEDEDED